MLCKTVFNSVAILISSSTDVLVGAPRTLEYGIVWIALAKKFVYMKVLVSLTKLRLGT